MICCMPGRMSKSAGAAPVNHAPVSLASTEARAAAAAILGCVATTPRRWTEKENVQQVQFDAVNAENTLGRQKWPGSETRSHAEPDLELARAGIFRDRSRPCRRLGSLQLRVYDGPMALLSIQKRRFSRPVAEQWYIRPT